MDVLKLTESMRGGGHVEPAWSSAGAHWSEWRHWFWHQAHWYFRSTLRHSEQSAVWPLAAERRTIWLAPPTPGAADWKSS